MNDSNDVIKRFEQSGYFVGHLEGSKCLDLKSFIFQIGLAFRFPDYYGQNLDALDECINDLDWIEQKNYVLAIMNSDLLLSNETTELRDSIWQFLERVRNEWRSVPIMKEKTNIGLKPTL